MMRSRSRSLSSRLLSLRLVALSARLAMGTGFFSLLACGGSSGGAATGGNSATGGSLASGGMDGRSGTGASVSTGGNGPGPGGASGGTALGGAGNGGMTVAGGSAGNAAAGMTLAGGAGGNAAGGIASGGGSGNGGSSGGSSASGQCPSDAYFCSGFEDASLPAALKTVYYNAQGLPTLDGTIHNSGGQSVTIGAKAGGGEMYLEAPASQSFWFRVYIRTDNGFTHNEHDAFMSLAWAGDDKGVEIVEENCMLTVNDHDTTWGSNGMMTQAGCHTDGVRLDANKWYCLEGFADGGNGDLRLYVGGTAAIQIAGNATLKHPYATFRFGYREYNGVDRSTWYDDVAVAPQRIGCLP